MIRFILVPSTTDPQLTPINNAVYNQLFWFNLDVVITTLYFTLENTSKFTNVFSKTSYRNLYPIIQNRLSVYDKRLQF